MDTACVTEPHYHTIKVLH